MKLLFPIRSFALRFEYLRYISDETFECLLAVGATCDVQEALLVRDVVMGGVLNACWVDLHGSPGDLCIRIFRAPSPRMMKAVQFACSWWFRVVTQ